MIDNSSYKSPNFSDRSEKIKYIVLHYTEMNFKDAASRLCNPSYEVSAHYLIKKDGKIYQLVDDEKKAWHAGVSFWRGENAINNSSIGIEIDSMGDSYSAEQMSSCTYLCKKLMNKYQITCENILAHSDISPNRKIDPGIFFNWKYLASEGIGIFHDIQADDTPEIMHYFGDSSTHILKLQSDLLYFGYNTPQTGDFDLGTNYVVRAFLSRYYPKYIMNLGGLDFYQNLESVYSWDKTANLILNYLLHITPFPR